MKKLKTFATAMAFAVISFIVAFSFSTFIYRGSDTAADRAEAFTPNPVAECPPPDSPPRRLEVPPAPLVGDVVHYKGYSVQELQHGWIIIRRKRMVFVPKPGFAVPPSGEMVAPGLGSAGAAESE